MKNLVIGIIVGLIFGIASMYLINDYVLKAEARENQNNNITDDFGRKYNIVNELFVEVSGEEVYSRIDNAESFILFVGRETCPYCQKTVPELHNAVLNSDYDSILYIDSENPDNSQFMYEQNFEGVPVTIFVIKGEVLSYTPGYVNEVYFTNIINGLKESITN